MTTVSAKPVLISRHHCGPQPRLASLLWTYPRWIHAEGRTHRKIRIAEDFEIMIPDPSPMQDESLSRNAASSRAIPVAKMIEAILSDPAIPLFWGKNVAGMQHKDELPKPLASKAKDIWLASMHSAIAYARAMCELGIDEDEKLIGAHKQIVNRMLEPYMHIKVLVSATEWNNFLALRDHPEAEPHIQLLARETRDALAARPQWLRPGQWHMPWTDDLPWDMPQDEKLKVSVARCASTSYQTVDGLPMTPDRAAALHDRLVASHPLHASPAEHPAQADDGYLGANGIPGFGWDSPQLHGNFVGFKQYRKMLPGEYVPG